MNRNVTEVRTAVVHPLPQQASNWFANNASGGHTWELRPKVTGLYLGQEWGPAESCWSHDCYLDWSRVQLDHTSLHLLHSLHVDGENFIYFTQKKSVLTIFFPHNFFFQTYDWMMRNNYFLFQQIKLFLSLYFNSFTRREFVLTAPPNLFFYFIFFLKAKLKAHTAAAAAAAGALNKSPWTITVIIHSWTN